MISETKLLAETLSGAETETTYMSNTYETIGIAQGVRAGDRAISLPIHPEDKERERQEKLARIERLKEETRRMKRDAGLCEKCGCDHCSGCDYDHDCFADD